MTGSGIPVIVVAAAIIERDGMFLVARRPPGVHLEGLWEFPGGKCDSGEPLDACLRREILEELGSESCVSAEILRVSHAYEDRIVELHFFRCHLLDEPRPLIGQEIRWVTGAGLVELDFPPADSELIALLRSGAAHQGGGA